ncbi:MAG TPA: nucleoside-diphosphate sugar epimerase/dehydratase [Ramlibacter sp.]|nr:nucleoside-diphosphate sugar epimerase/dehydratase [Ramlibacter sp.]
MISSRVLDWPEPAKRSVVVALDFVLALVATWVAFTLRFDTANVPQGNQWIIYALAPAIALPVFVKFGLYRAIFRYTGMAALGATARAVGVYAVVLLAVVLLLQRQGFEGLPRTVAVMQPIVYGVLVGASRALARYLFSGRGNRPERRLLIYGAGSAGVQTAAALASTRQYALLGFIDDDVRKAGRTINNARVYLPAEIANLVDRLGVTDILLAIPSAPRQRRNEIIGKLSEVPVHIRTLPGMEDLASGRVTVSDLRELEIDDLLGRPPVAPDPALLARNSAGKGVLVTGAGGSIGAELCRQVLREKPARLLMLDHSEFALYTIHEELTALAAKLNLATELVPLLGTVTSYPRVQEICRTWQPEVVYHAAAYKHVPMVEHNPAEGVANNVFGTLNVARAALESGAAHFVLISTDKAVRPTNVMGATKRVAEMILQALSQSASPEFRDFDPKSVAVANRTHFVMVRFGNVLGSSGSAVPLFRKQIAMGGPVTVTHADVTRYFMTIPEATQLVVQAGAMAQGGEVFVLDMGEPVRILDLVKRMVALSGMTVRDALHPAGDIEVVISGLRPGEKLYEELLIGDDPHPTPHPRIMQAREQFIAWPQLAPRLRALADATERNEVATIRAILAELVPGATLAHQVFDHVFQARRERELLELSAK